MHGLLIQPTVETLDEYAAFAAERGLGFEMVGLAYPAALDGDLAAVVDRYKSFPDQARPHGGVGEHVGQLAGPHRAGDRGRWLAEVEGPPRHRLLFSREPLERWFEVLGENIAYLHLTDNLGERDDELPLGSGKVDWPEISRLANR